MNDFVLGKSKKKILKLIEELGWVVENKLQIYSRFHSCGYKNIVSWQKIDKV
jgi:hypothetical protein